VDSPATCGLNFSNPYGIIRLRSKIVEGGHDMKFCSSAALFVSILLGISAAAAGRPGQTPISDEVFKSGKIRFVPRVTITDESLGGKGFFSQPSDIAVDDKGRVYVSDTKENNVKVFDAAGAFLKTIGRAGQGPGEFNSLWKIEFSRGRLCAIERGRITFFDAKGVFLQSKKIERGITWRKARALPDGRFLVEKNLVDRQNPGFKEETLLDLYSASFDFLKTIYRREVRRHKPITKPVSMDLSLPFLPDVLWDILPNGQIAVGYSGSYKIEFHDPDNGIISAFNHPYKPIEVTAEDKKIHFDGVSYMTQDGSNAPPVLHRGAADYMIKNAEFPKFKPPFVGLRIDAQGRVWVQLSGPAMEKDGSRFDIFDRHGRFIGSISIKDGYFPRRMLSCEDGFWTIRPTSEGEFTIVKYGIEAVRIP
jgi:hypothetical protein